MKLATKVIEPAKPGTARTDVVTPTFSGSALATDASVGYDVIPAKSDVIFIHGTGSNSEMWASQVKTLTNLGHRCFLIDLRGHGQTPEVFETTNIQVHLDDVMETLQSLPINYPATFVGHSLGAIISMELAQLHPEMFDQICAVGMPGKVYSIVVSLFKVVLLFPYEKLRGTALHKALPWRLKTLISTQRFTLMQIVANFRGLDYISSPFKISCPVHFSAGRFDPVAPFPFVKRMHNSLPQSTLRVFEFAGHNHMDQYPGQFNNWLSNSLHKK
jgi:pimeloyl-ACP methyl ester carboxylesterase